MIVYPPAMRGVRQEETCLPNLTGIRRSAPYIASGLGFCGIGGGLYYMFVERGYKVEGPKTDISGSLEEFFKKLQEWLENHMGGGKPPQPPGENPGIPDTVSSSAHSSSGTSTEGPLAHLPVEVLALVAVAMVILAIGYQCYASQKASPRMGRG